MQIVSPIIISPQTQPPPATPHPPLHPHMSKATLYAWLSGLHGLHRTDGRPLRVWRRGVSLFHIIIYKVSSGLAWPSSPLQREGAAVSSSPTETVPEQGRR